MARKREIDTASAVDSAEQAKERFARGDDSANLEGADEFRVLVVDDEPMIRRFLSSGLKERGYITETANSGMEALDLAREFQPDILLTDLHMPIMDGIETISRMREILPHVIPIVFTGDASMDSAIVALREGAFEFLAKPFSLDLLTAAFDRAIAFRNLQQSERRRQELEIRRSAEQEIRDRKLKLDAWRSLSARSAHRIGNQLFAARGAVRTVKKLKNPEALEAVADLEACLERVRRIVQEFQSFSQAEEPRLLSAQVGPVLEDIVRRYRRIRQNINWSARVSQQLPLCLIDREQMDQAIGELLENAIHHTSDGGSIRVTAKRLEARDGERIRITVEDSGPGVSEEDKTRIFQPFVSKRPGGTGLGLAIVSQIVENHKGTIRETGKPGKGARFEIDLPTLPAEED